MSTYTDNYVNPLELDVWSLDPNDSKGMVREKGEFMLGLCEPVSYTHLDVYKRQVQQRDNTRQERTARTLGCFFSS